MIFRQRLIRKKKRKREKDEHYDFSNVQTMMRERCGLAPRYKKSRAIENYCSEKQKRALTLQQQRGGREKRNGALGAGKQGQGRKFRAGGIGDWGLGGTWAGKEGQCRKAWAGDMGQWGARAGRKGSVGKRGQETWANGVRGQAGRAG